MNFKFEFLALCSLFIAVSPLGISVLAVIVAAVYLDWISAVAFGVTVWSLWRDLREIGVRLAVKFWVLCAPNPAIKK